MGESVSPWTPSCNGSVRVELSGQHTTSDSGALLLREALDSSGTIAALEEHLVDPRDPQRVRHSLASQLRTVVMQRTMGWIDLSDTTTLRRDPLWRLACSDARGTTPLAQDRPSQATLSRLLACRGSDDNIDVIHEGLLLSLYAYQVLHGLRCLLERRTSQGWSLIRMREQVLKVAATLSVHARRNTVHLGDAADKWCPTLLKGLPRLTALV